ncbi:MAG: sulfocyanin-like copper-binding protein [Acidimicrobiia bacterium]
MKISEGEYTIYCDIPGHRQGGMEATLVVTPGGEEPAEGAPPTATGPADDAS